MCDVLWNMVYVFSVYTFGGCVRILKLMRNDKSLFGCLGFKDILATVHLARVLTYWFCDVNETEPNQTEWNAVCESDAHCSTIDRI